MGGFSEDVVEQATLDWFEALNYEVLHGPDIAPGEHHEARAAYEDVLLLRRLEGEGRADLREILRVASSGVVFTTIQKFMPEAKGDSYPLSDRRNIVVIADEAHRSQYDFIDGYARHLRDALPGASFVGVTGTPIELTDKNTRAVFGNYISTYDIQRAGEDGATVPIYYESRLAKIALKEAEKPTLDTRSRR